MALIIYNTSTCGILTAPARHRGLPPLPSSHQANLLSFPSAPPLRPQRHSPRRSTHVARARKGLSSRTRRLEERSKKGAATTTTTEDEESAGVALEDGEEDVPLEGYAWPPPQLPGEQTGFWEGPQWNALGFVVQYLWAFGIVFALIACGIAVATYNEGATDFKQTPVYKESMQSRELLEEPEASNADVFEGNPTEEAPSLE